MSVADEELIPHATYLARTGFFFLQVIGRLCVFLLLLISAY